MRIIAPCLTMLVSALIAGGASGQSIQKCVNPDGKIVYQDTPCDAKAKTAATIQRDRATADSAALQRAQAERERADSYSRERAQEYAAEQDRLMRVQEAEAAARAVAEAEARADARAGIAAAQQQPTYPAQPIVIQERTTINNRIVLPPPAPPPKPATYSGPVPPKK